MMQNMYQKAKSMNILNARVIKWSAAQLKHLFIDVVYTTNSKSRNNIKIIVHLCIR